MKKILVAIALALVLTTLMVLPAFAAENAAISVEELIKWNVNGVHYVGKATTTPPVQDGKINEGEYSYKFRMDDPIFQATSDWKWNKAPTDPNADFSSNYTEYYASYDDEYVYIAMFDDQSRACGKDLNFYIELGINADNVNDLLGPGYQGNGGQLMNRGGSTKTNFYAGSTSGKDSQYVPINGKQIKIVDTVYHVSKDDGQGAFDAVYELKFKRADILEIFNGLGKTGYAESPNVFFFTVKYNQYGNNDNIAFYRWCGSALSNVEKLNLGTDKDFIPAVFVLAEEGDDFLGNGDLEIPTKPAETEAPTTEAPTTEAPTTEAPTTEAPATEAPATEAPATEAPATEAPATEAPATEAPAEGGCGSSVATMGIALVAVLGTCTAVVSKKKED